MEENNRSFFERIMDKVTYISDKQTLMLKNTQATHKETLAVLQKIVSINNEMQSTLEKYNSSAFSTSLKRNAECMITRG